MKKFKIYTFGCRTNKYESQLFIEQLSSCNCSYCKEDENVDLFIINTCAVTHSGEKTSFLKVKELLKKYPQKKIIVTGCIVPFIDSEKYKNILTVKNEDKEKLVSLIFPKEKFENGIKSFLGQTRAFVKIQDGCDNFCSYCIIPFVRGRSRSRPIDEIRKEVEELVQNGFKEVVLTGIDIGDYSDGKFKLVDILKSLVQIKDLMRLRISSIDPNQLDEGLIEMILSERKIMPSLHLSLQSGSNEILKKMNRNYLIEDFYEVVNNIKHRNPEFTFTTDVIVGFPGESDADFLKTVKVIEKVGFAKVHIFPYSKRQKTRAFYFKEQIDQKIIKKRVAYLKAIAEKRAFNLRDKYLKKVLSVLIESRSKQGMYLGHSENFLPIKVKASSFCKNSLIEVLIETNEKETLIGKRI